MCWFCSPHSGHFQNSTNGSNRFHPLGIFCWREPLPYQRLTASSFMLNLGSNTMSAPSQGRKNGIGYRTLNLSVWTSECMEKRHVRSGHPRVWRMRNGRNRGLFLDVGQSALPIPRLFGSGRCRCDRNRAVWITIRLWMGFWKWPICIVRLKICCERN